MLQQIVGITSQGQASIPAKYRKKLGLSAPGKALITLEGKKITITPATDVLSLGGTLKTKRKALSSKQIRENFGNYLANRKPR